MTGPFRELELPGVFLARVERHEDARGWLVETFRTDWLEAAGLAPARPQMAYVSLTRPGVVRGPHAHSEQTDLFAFIGPSDFKVFLWDNRAGSAVFGRRLTLVLGETAPGLLLVPPGVVHAYRNVGRIDGLVMNYPNRLFAGPGRAGPVDEIRYEDRPDSGFRLED
uniref:dTDP-4-dehydrorhamnose 3,5-epimerase n=1 Tax=candidate division WOR-3 bacterium TaxID=2052148 RepID=A0A7C4CB74_UNCW3